MVITSGAVTPVIFLTVTAVTAAFIHFTPHLDFHISGAALAAAVRIMAFGGVPPLQPVKKRW